MSRLIYFIRHGQTDWNAEQRFQGGKDIPLNDKGRGQARRNGQVLRDLIEAEAFHFVASPLSRTRETMEIVRAQIGVPAADYAQDARLKELSFGAWEGHTAAELETREPELWAQRHADKWGFVPPEGESYAMLAERLRGWLEDLDRPSVVVAHGGVNRALRALLEGSTPNEDAHIPVPQDKIMIVRDETITWV